MCPNQQCVGLWVDKECVQCLSHTVKCLGKLAKENPGEVPSSQEFSECEGPVEMVDDNLTSQLIQTGRQTHARETLLTYEASLCASQTALFFHKIVLCKEKKKNIQLYQRR